MSQEIENTKKLENSPKGKQKENPWVSLIFNIVIPVLILSKFSTIAGNFFPDKEISPALGLIIALAFPVCYFIYEYVKTRQTSFIAILGFVSIFLTGIIGVFELPSEWIAYKEASVPFLIGVAILISLKTPYPLVKKLLYNDEFIDVEKVEKILEEKNSKEQFEKVLVNSTYILALSFLVSTVLNFALAKYLIHSPSGTEAFNQELSKMTSLSYLVIALPSTIVMMVALYYLTQNVKKITGLTFEEMLAPQLRDKIEEADKKENAK